jgi:hypothetical protein
MSGDFRIEIVPGLPEGASAAASGRDYHALRQEVLARTNEWRQLVYRTGVDMFADYPADILTVLADLEREAAALAGGQSHLVEISGRPVAYALCRSGRVWFLPPDQRNLASPAGEGTAARDVLAQFEAIAGRVRGYLDGLLSDPSA